MLKTMFRALLSASTLVVVALPLVGGDLASTHTPAVTAVAVILDFKGSAPPRTVAEMKRQTEETMRGSGFQLDWRMRSEAAGQSYGELVLVTFHGNCKFQDAAAPERGVPLAQTYMNGDQVQPFADVACDTIAALARTAILHRGTRNPDVMLGGAIGRVLAHELMHLLTRSAEHGKAGVAQPSFTGEQLVQANLSFETHDLERLQRGSR